MSDEDLLFEIGCEELPASFVAAAVAALPELAEKLFRDKRLAHGEMRALGTPRRLALVISRLAERQADLEEAVMGPPVSAAFKDGKPTKAAEAFAHKLGCQLSALERIDTPKGPYLRGIRSERGRPAMELLPTALAQIARAIPFRKSMRWGSGSLAFGRPIRWLCALFDREVVPVDLDGMRAGRISYGHRFLHPGAVEIAGPQTYVDQLRAARVYVDMAERRALMTERLHQKAEQLGGALVADEFLSGENASLVEDPQVVAGSFDREFLALPEDVILEVARGHQRYFCVRGGRGALLPRYLAVVNTAEDEPKVVHGNDRVMRARLADAQFFLHEDQKKRLADRKPDLAGIVFQKQLGTVLDKVNRIQEIIKTTLPGDACTLDTARKGAELCKCDLTTLMVGEFPELQGAIGRSYAIAEGVDAVIADVISDHYKPKGAKDEPARSGAAALVAIADRLDTLVGCFGIGLKPTGTADPYALRRACIAILRTVIERDLFSISIHALIVGSQAAYRVVNPTLTLNSETAELELFIKDRLRGLLCESLPADAVEAALGVAADRPVDARARAGALAALDSATRARLGEVFKRATNIAKEAPEGAPPAGAPSEEPAEKRLFEAFFEQKEAIERAAAAADYPRAFRRIAELAPALAEYFDQVLVMAEDAELRANRLRLMRAISSSCSNLAQLELLATTAS